jgi:uncharacterized repeat protein (TIGR01451 family)
MFRSLVFIASLLVSGTVYAQCPVTINQNYVTLCDGQNTYLTATSGGTNYQWFQNGVPVGVNSDTLHLIGLSPGNYQYAVEMSVNTCIDTSAVAYVSVIAPPTVSASSNTPCVGSTLTLWSTVCIGCQYSWTGPNGFTSSFQNPSIGNVQYMYSGVYTVCASQMGCVACDTVQVTVVTGSIINAGNNGPVCIGDTLKLTADTINGATYSWTGPGGFTSNQQNPTLIVNNNTQGGNYIVTVNNGNCIVDDTTVATVCNTGLVRLYVDINSNCSFDGGESHPLAPASIKVDSNGIVVDTISTLSGFYYTMHGQPGDTYDFELLNIAGGLVPTCPNTGIVSHTIQNTSLTAIDMGFECGVGNTFDLSIHASNPASSAVTQSGYIYVQNTHCFSTNSTVTLQHSPKYQYNSAYPLPASVSGNTITWNINNLSVLNTNPTSIHYDLTYSTTPLIAGDTTHSYFNISPTTGDTNIANNTWTKVDTVVASYDPNAIMAYPEGCVTAGTKLQYTIMFENIGNAPAENIYVMDTLPGELEANTMELVMSSHNMYVTKLQSGGNTIFRFDFPNINLPDSSDHAGCHGMLVYTINTNSTLPYGADIDHRAGIYFDYNSVVMTNTYRTSICVPANVSTVSVNGNIMVFPNPAGDELTLQTDGSFNNCTITNSIGQVMLQQDLNAKSAKLNIQPLAPGIYYMNVKGEGVQEVLKFVKM